MTYTFNFRQTKIHKETKNRQQGHSTELPKLLKMQKKHELHNSNNKASTLRDYRCQSNPFKQSSRDKI